MASQSYSLWPLWSIVSAIERFHCVYFKRITDVNNGWGPVKSGEKMKIALIENQNFLKTPLTTWKNVKTIGSEIDI